MAEYIEREAKMQNESICRSCFHSYVCERFNEHRNSHNKKCHFFNDHYVSAADVVEVETLEAWLYKMAMNNDVYFADVCEEIISRLDGLRYFQRERRSE